MINELPACGLPLTRVGHAQPGLLWRQGLAFLQQFNGDVVRGTDKSHAAVTRWTIDGYTLLLQVFTEFVDIVYLVGNMAEVTPFAIDLGIPVIRQFDLGIFITG